MFADVGKVQVANVVYLLYKVQDCFHGKLKRGVWMDIEHRGRHG